MAAATCSALPLAVLPQYKRAVWSRGQHPGQKCSALPSQVQGCVCVFPAMDLPPSPPLAYTQHISLLTLALSHIHSPCIHSPCRPGASEDQLDEAEHQLGTTLCPALRVLYRVHDGQELEFDRQVDKQRTSMHDSIFHGMFGGRAGGWADGWVGG